jgi:hypothetical protein
VQLLTNNRETHEQMRLRKRYRDVLREEEEMEDPTAHEAISVAEWKAQNCDKGKRSPRQALHG